MPPPINHAVLASVGIVVASVTVAAAIAIYEIPEVRRAAEDLRRRIAIALHALGDNVDPARQPPRFNRPEDAEGFYQSHDVDADEETRRRQREELMYWNMRREQQLREQGEPPHRPRAQTFDDILAPDHERSPSGTLVYNTGASARDLDPANLVRRRGNAEGVRGLSAAALANPFSDEYGIELDDRPQLPSPPRDEVMSDIYGATPRVQTPQVPDSQPLAVLSPIPVPSTSEVLFDYESQTPTDYGTALSATTDSDAHDEQRPTRPATPDRASTPTPATPSSRSATLDRELADGEHMTAGQDRIAADAYASIQAWARGSSSHSYYENSQHGQHYDGGASFYSPLPHTPQAPASEPELVSAGQLTPTSSDSASVVDVSPAAAAAAAAAESAAAQDRSDDVLSVTDGGVPTPASWSDVGSVVSESDSAWRG
ncbi:hypothetical protein VTJ83DRAFT_4975 [Remersonia thermophila]|uniref:Uncharacterized protein n=1 Tax=Remersonia thermophila TaxID=72144 RepID=A0ABR4DBG3_9PEZI